MRAPYLNDGDVRLYVGDCIEVMREMEAESVDAVVCDPPYGLEFMGKEWDSFGRNTGNGYTEKPRFTDDHMGKGFRSLPNHFEAGSPFAAWCETWAREALRVLKPGGHLLAFGGTRTFHRLTCGIEDAGFEVRDCLSWLYGSGFPKSLDVSKAIDKRRDDRADVLRVTAEVRRLRDAAGLTNRDLDGLFGFAGMAGHWTTDGTQPTVPTVDQWGVLREVLNPPAWVESEVCRLNIRKGEPGEAWCQREVVGRGRSAIANKDEGPRHTVGASKAVEFDITALATDAAREWQGWGTALKPAFEPVVVARKPLVGTVAANVQQHGTGALNIDGCRIGTSADDLDAMQGRSGARTSGDVFPSKGDGRAWEPSTQGRWPANVAFDEAAAAMLDAQTGERPSGARRAGDYGGIGAGPLYGEGGITALPEIEANTGGASRFFYTAKASRADRNAGGLAENTHPTVKPTDLMRWLVRLVTPPGGVVLDPFAGSGTTLVAARAEGFRAIGIEREDEYARIIADRLSQLSLFSEAS